MTAWLRFIDFNGLIHEIVFLFYLFLVSNKVDIVLGYWKMLNNKINWIVAKTYIRVYLLASGLLDWTKLELCRSIKRIHIEFVMQVWWHEYKYVWYNVICWSICMFQHNGQNPENPLRFIKKFFLFKYVYDYSCV